MKNFNQKLVFYLVLVYFTAGCTYDVEHVYVSENCKTDFYGFPEIPGWSFENVKLPEDTSGITDIFFITEEKGLLFRYTGIWLTMDDGVNWEKVFSADQVYVYTATFSDELHGFVSASFEGKYCILKTLDGGYTWSVIDLQSEDRIIRISFTDSLNGVATFSHWTTDPNGRRAYYQKSGDGGITWEEMAGLSASSNDGITMKLYANGFGYLPGTSGEIHLTEDFGSSWKTINTDFNSMFDLQFLDVNTGFVGIFPALHKTTDGGATWVEISDNFSFWFNFFSPEEGVSLQRTYLDFDLDADEFIQCMAFLSTSEGGIAWIEGPPSVNFNMSDIQFINNHIGFARTNIPEYKFVKLER